jgi:hypothetical protein
MYVDGKPALTFMSTDSLLQHIEDAQQVYSEFYAAWNSKAALARQ